MMDAHTHTLGPPGPTNGGVVYIRWGRTTRPALLEHSCCMLEGQLEVSMITEEVKLTTSAYQSSHSTLPTLLEYRVDGCICMGLSIRLEVLTLETLDHFILLLNTMFHVQFVILQHVKLL